MSAGTSSGGATVSRDLAQLAPRFRDAVQKAVADCQARGMDAYVYEGYRSPELQALYYQRGRTIIPPVQKVTNARSSLYSWHGYGLAVDVISRRHGWDRPESWFRDVAESFRKFGCKWGGDWKMKDLPHFQWGLCQASPSDSARSLFAQGGAPAVWKVVSAE
ncbi:MAG TPA: M15 family metallopeptidase [Longimicrobium sp.]|nr:M15 family metallopeptidase [Longimicrobium sp.]